ncbi:hypothetical protein GECvBMG_gp187 [Salmonella phage GEC_vB_MG]|uniref:Uncharacterized protein 174 n=1 Tax=Salmonella phage PVPSE1 TaxID=889338 RepID=G3BM40_9CAUD|nr:hypothetical protein PVP-SE1_gp174 [Salmonella phage PVPSE1]QPI14731.1 hypothetical protein GECvBMG_gp187 [Salmonella phage GEC_vB_MG]WAK43659.1 hypothetical protein EspYZU15_159 [Cronobacter phage EspYZU15]WAK45565.1 hypothetical protein EspYZU14_161 [Cronobacter phage EspYZU14]WBF78349.1 hypothetical protein [Cronobacter phage EspYZU12]WNT48207.1 hypothetical protein SPLA5a_PHROGS00124 [Salmonella phage SPLA5a]HDR2377142.1 hypothetical protein [Enterobacter asburiae]
MCEKYGDAREELGRMIERKEILEEILSDIDLCMQIRNGAEKGSQERANCSLLIDALIHTAQKIQKRGLQ